MIQLSPVPMMNPAEVAAFTALLQKRRPTRVLEWGAGGSTLYWPAMFQDIEWVSIEHDPAYVESLIDRVPSNVQLIHKAFPEYCRQPADGLFDVILVDGRQRLLCLSFARRLLAPGGVVVLHDSARERYKPAWSMYGRSAVLSAPTKSKDPRGLVQFTEPRPDAHGGCGVMYMVWGSPAARQARDSIRSLWKLAPGVPVVVVGDAAAVPFFRAVPGVTAVTVDVDPFTSTSDYGFKAGTVKPLLASLSPFDRTVYVDADTEWLTSPAYGFSLLDRWDFIIAEAETRSLAETFPNNKHEANATAAALGTAHILYHNSGLFFWRRSAECAELFSLWSEEWLRYRGWDEQIALLRALLRSSVLWLNVPFTWNCRGQKSAYMVFHRFAGRAARKYGPAQRSYGLARPLRPSASKDRPLVQVQLQPGRFVKCRAGDEALVLEQFEKSRGSRVKT